MSVIVNPAVVRLTRIQISVGPVTPAVTIAEDTTPPSVFTVKSQPSEPTFEAVAGADKPENNNTDVRELKFVVPMDGAVA
jgi:hypothetical protein